MPAHFILSSLIPLALTGEWYPLAACLPSFLSSLPPYLPPCLSLFSPSIFLSIPPSLYSLISMFLISSVQIPEIFKNLSYIVYDTQGTMLSLTCLVTTFPGLMCLYQPEIRTQQKLRHAHIPRHLGFELLESAWNFSKFWVELCFKWFFFQSSERKFSFENIFVIVFEVNARRASGMCFHYTGIWVVMFPFPTYFLIRDSCFPLRYVSIYLSS